MIKVIFLTLSLFLSLSALAEPTAVENTEQAKLLVESKCQTGCLILSKEDIAALEAAFEEQLKKAYTVGLHTCRNSV